MPRKIKEYTRQDLIDVALPNHASTYTVISHKSVMDLSTKALEDAGFKIIDEKYRATHDGNIASAIYTLNYGDDPELSMMFAWSNSYNKQMRFKCGIGAIHTTNKTTMVCGDMGSWARKHIGTADTETEDTIKEQVSLAKMYYNQLVSDKERMKEITLDRKKQAQLLGILFADEEVLTTEQASMIRQQMSRPTHTFTDNYSLWAFYNYVTLALQQSHPKTWMEDQRVLHWFISEAFKFDKVENEEVDKGTVTLLPSDSESEEEPVDPAQVDLEDSIAEIEAEQKATIEEQRAEYWDQQTRIEEGLDHKGGLTNDELAADAEMQEMKTEQVIEEREEEDENPVYDEDQIAERIREDEAAVAEVCDEQEVTYEEAQEYIANQMEADKLDADEADNSVSDENIDNVVKGADFDMDFAVANSDEEEADDDVDFDFA
jgi:hypothetical protein